MSRGIGLYDMHTVFVYGTLKRGFRLHHNMKDARFLGQGILSGYRMHRITWYPAILPDADFQVFGELFQVNGSTLDILDDVEDRGILYERVVERIGLIPHGNQVGLNDAGDGEAGADKASIKKHLADAEARHGQTSDLKYSDSKSVNSDRSPGLGSNSMHQSGALEEIQAFVYVYMHPLEEGLISSGIFEE